MRLALAALAGVLLSGPVMAQERYYDWSGLYLGAHGGYAQGDASVKDTTGGVLPGPFDYSPEGGFGGGQIGFNVQHSALVAGIEADLGYLDLSGKGLAPSSNPGYHQDLTLDGGLYAVVAGRLGFTVGRTLVYGKGGWVYFDGEAGQTTTFPGYVTHSSDALTGWAYGGGIEQALGHGWSLKGEYLHFDFDTADGDQTSVDDPPKGFVYKNETDVSADTFKVGVNYRWGARDDWAPLK